MGLKPSVYIAPLQSNDRTNGTRSTPKHHQPNIGINGLGKSKCSIAMVVNLWRIAEQESS